MAKSQYVVRVYTVDDSPTSDKNLVNFGPVTPGLHAGLCHAFLVLIQEGTLSELMPLQSPKDMPAFGRNY